MTDCFMGRLQGWSSLTLRPTIPLSSASCGKGLLFNPFKVSPQIIHGHFLRHNCEK